MPDAPKAIEVCKEFRPDLILLDIMLPGKIDGFSLLRGLKHNEHFAHIPVILISALASEDIVLEGLKHGANDYLVKPFNLNQLLLKVKNLLDVSLKNRHNALVEKFIPFSLQPSHNNNTILHFDEILERLIATDASMSIQEIAKELNISQSTLARIIKKKFNITPNRYILERKLEKARILIKSGKGLPIKEISFSLGFSSVSYFSKCYKQFYGHQPSVGAK